MKRGSREMKTITQQTKDGRTVEYQIEEYLNRICVNVRLNGKSVASGTPEATGKTINGMYIYGEIGRVQMGNEQVWNDVLAAYDEAKSQLEATDAYKTTELRRQREKLALDVKYSRDELHEAEQRVVERAMQGERHAVDSQLSYDVEMAEWELKKFDDAHPEIIAGLKAEREASLERNRWN